jgi:hypothetical protein
MGQRTITVVRLHYKLKDSKKDKYITKAYHQQWGLGRCMLNEVLAGFIRLDSKFVYLGGEAKTVREELKLKVDNAMLGSSLHDDTEWHENRKYFNGEIIDMEKVIANHDNDDGGCFLNVELDEYSSIEQAHLQIYNNEGKFITLKKWCDRYPEYCNKQWQTGFRSMFENLSGRVA